VKLPSLGIAKQLDAIHIDERGEGFFFEMQRKRVFDAHIGDVRFVEVTFRLRGFTPRIRDHEDSFVRAEWLGRGKGRLAFATATE
jgi:hypothetical protein